MEVTTCKDLQEFMNVLPVIKSAVQYDFGFSLADKEKYLLFIPASGLDIKVSVGDPIKEGSGIWRAIHERQQVIFRADKALRGVSYIACSSPVFNKDGELIGAITIAESTDRYDTLKEIAGGLATGIAELASTTEEISAQSQEIAAVSRQMCSSMKESEQRMSDTDRIMGMIRDIANQTNLLGLNAAIEAARVGDAGRGFGVVAGEIRKLSTSSADSIKEIVGILTTIKADSNRSVEEIVRIEASVGQVADAISTLAAAVQEFSTMAQRLDVMADSLSSRD